MRFARWVFVGALVAIVMFSTPIPSSAQSASDPPKERTDAPQIGTTRANVSKANKLVLNANAKWLPKRSTGSTGGSDPNCGSFDIELVIEDDFVQVVDRNRIRFGTDLPPGWFSWSDQSLTSPKERIFSPTGRWYQMICDGLLTIVPEGGPAVSVNQLVADVLRILDPPKPGLELRPADGFYAQTQSWLAVDEIYWGAVRQGTSSAGRVSVTGTLTPYLVEWEMGDGETVECDGPGTVWTVDLDPMGKAACGYTYKKSSARERDGTFNLRSTVKFEVEVTKSTPGPNDSYPDVVRTTEQEIDVREIQALN